MIDKIMMDGEPLEVGDPVWCLVNGLGKVEELNMGVSTYQIDVNFNGSLGSYTQDFQFFKGTNRTLYWQEPEIIPPPKPKKKIKVWDWYVEYIGTGLIKRCNGATEEFIRTDYKNMFIQKIDGTEREDER